MPLTRSFTVKVCELNDLLDAQKTNALLVVDTSRNPCVSIELRLDTPQVTSVVCHFGPDEERDPNANNNSSVQPASKLSPFLYPLGDRCLLLVRRCSGPDGPTCQSVYRLRFASSEERDICQNLISPQQLTSRTNGHGDKKRELPMSVFDERTDSTSAKQYFQFYALLSQQQNMLQDFVRTSTYQRAMHLNCVDFMDKVVLDVGTGTGILSYFAIQSGARKVYAVEASNMADYCQKMVNANNMAGRIIVVNGKVEEISLPEPVDLIISEPMGYMLFNERMLESYVHARKFLRNPQHHPKGDKVKPTETPAMETSEGDVASETASPPAMMFPSVANLYVAPFTDEALFLEIQGKANFWFQQSFHGVNLSSLQTEAMKEYIAQPVVDTFDINICMAKAESYHVDFRTCEESDLYDIRIPLRFTMFYSGLVHGLAFWFDVAFLGTQQTVWLSTSPNDPLTHWYQVRCLFPTPLFAQEGHELEGLCHMKCNDRQSYDVYIELTIPGTNTKISNTLDLKNPCFRYTGFPSQAPAGQTQQKAPTELYYERMASNAATTTTALMSAGSVVSQQQHQSGEPQPLPMTTTTMPQMPRGVMNLVGVDTSQYSHASPGQMAALSPSNCFSLVNGMPGGSNATVVSHNVVLTTPSTVIANGGLPLPMARTTHEAAAAAASANPGFFRF